MTIQSVETWHAQCFEVREMGVGVGVRSRVYRSCCVPFSSTQIIIDIKISLSVDQSQKLELLASENGDTRTVYDFLFSLAGP